MEQAVLETAPTQPAPQLPVVTPTDEAAELTVTRKDLLEELMQLQDVAARKTSIPILCNILMQTNGQVLLLTATDCEIGLRTSCPARVKKQGAFTIPARKLYDYIRLLPEGDINIKVLANEWVQLRSGRSHTKMVGLAVSDSASGRPSHTHRGLLGKGL